MKHYILWFWSGNCLYIETDNLQSYMEEYATSLETVEEIPEKEFNEESGR